MKKEKKAEYSVGRGKIIQTSESKIRKTKVSKKNRKDRGLCGV